jgi:DNA primase catalytic subunit
MAGIEARCMWCGNPMGDLMFDVMAKHEGTLRTEFCEECLEKHIDEILDTQNEVEAKT